MYILKTIWSKWKTIAHHIGIFQSRLILSVFYFSLLMPWGIIFSLFKDELKMKNKKLSTWKTKDKQSATVEELKEQS